MWGKFNEALRSEFRKYKKSPPLRAFVYFTEGAQLHH
jgi:hypothetical protein